MWKNLKLHLNHLENGFSHRKLQMVNISKKRVLLETELFPKTATKIWQDGNVSLNTVTILFKNYNLRLDQVIQYKFEEESNNSDSHE